MICHSILWIFQSTIVFVKQFLNINFYLAMCVGHICPYSYTCMSIYISLLFYFCIFLNIWILSMVIMKKIIKNDTKGYLWGSYSKREIIGWLSLDFLPKEKSQKKSLAYTWWNGAKFSSKIRQPLLNSGPANYRGSWTSYWLLIFPASHA